MHVVAAIQVRIVGQAFPADGGARFFDVGAHHQEHLVTDLSGQARQTLGVLAGRAGVVQRARADDQQQALIFAVENGAYGLAMGFDLGGEGGGQRHLLLEQQRARQTLADSAVGSARFGQWQSEGGRLHVLDSWAAGGVWPAWSALSRCSTVGRIDVMCVRATNK
ncbi:hypothetical protein D9M71_534030 [compost metagenome]